VGRFVKGEVVVLPFPFSDLSEAKRRPALVIVSLEGDDVILCQITSKSVSDSYAIELAETDFADGKLSKDSNIRPNRIFTADSKIILYRVGKLKSKKLNEVVDQVIQMVRS
jgi:mRNA interferase MazF